MSICTLKDVDIRGKRVLIREDLNVPVAEGKVVSDARIRAALPTLRYAVEQGARTMVMSHLGRPQEGVPISEQVDASLAPVADRIEELSGLSVALVESYVDGFEHVDAEIVLFENVRINAGEKNNDASLAKKVIERVPELIKKLPRVQKEAASAAWRDYGEVLLCSSNEEMAELSNNYAPEHLELQTQNKNFKLTQDDSNVALMYL